MSEYSELFDWDSEIEEDGKDFIVVEPGDYTFTVKSIDRKNFAGSDKIPACNMVTVNGVISTPKGDASFFENLYLVRKNEWKLSGFFRCLGMKKHGEKLRMDWNGAIGRKGRAKFGNRDYKGSTYNQLLQYYDYDESQMNGGFKETKDDDVPW